MQAITTCSPGDGGSHTLKAPRAWCSSATSLFPVRRCERAAPGLLINFRDDPGADDIAQRRMSSALTVQPPQSGPAPCYNQALICLADTQQLTYRVIGEMPGAT